MNFRIAIAAIVLLIISGILFAFYAGGTLADPVPARVGNAPRDLNAENVTIPSKSGSWLHGWFCRALSEKGAVLLLAGVRANRLSMVERGRFLIDAGYSVLLVDLQGTGESPGKRITFGYLESRDATAAVNFLRMKCETAKIGVIGSSLGGAAVVLAEPPLDIDALVLESVYPTIDRAVKNRLRIRFGSAGSLLAPLLVLQLKPRIGIGAKGLRPSDTMKNVTCPVLIMSGTNDRHTTPSDTLLLFRNANPPKMLWLVPGAGHVDLHQFARREYEGKVLGFFANAMTRRRISS